MRIPCGVDDAAVADDEDDYDRDVIAAESTMVAFGSVEAVELAMKRAVVLSVGDTALNGGGSRLAEWVLGRALPPGVVVEV